MHQNSLLKEYS